MTEEEYLKIKNDPKADKLPVLFFFAKLRGLRGIMDIGTFGAFFQLWVPTLARRYAGSGHLQRIYYYVEAELDKHFK